MKTKAKTLESMSYQQWQQRNTKLFQSLDKENQKKVRQQGYYNVGWDKIQRSWEILSKLSPKIISLFEYKLNQGDILGAIDLSILEAENGKSIATNAIEQLNQNQKKLEHLVGKTLTKYSLL